MNKRAKYNICYRADSGVEWSRVAVQKERGKNTFECWMLFQQCPVEQQLMTQVWQWQRHIRGGASSHGPWSWRRLATGWPSSSVTGRLTSNVALLWSELTKCLAGLACCCHWSPPVSITASVSIWSSCSLSSSPSWPLQDVLITQCSEPMSTCDRHGWPQWPVFASLLQVPDCAQHVHHQHWGQYTPVHDNVTHYCCQDDEREITTPDSLLSDTKDTAPDSPLSHALTMSKTPDSALVSADNITTRSAGAGLCLGLMRKNARTR